MSEVKTGWAEANTQDLLALDKEELVKLITQQREEFEGIENENYYLRKNLTEMQGEQEDFRMTQSESMNGMKSIKEQISEMKTLLQDMRETLTGSLKDVLRWRKNNGINDKAELGQIMQSARKPAQDRDNGPSGPKGP